MVVDFTFTSLGADYCFTTPQQFQVDLVERLAGEVVGSASFFIYSATTPAPDERDRPWIRLDANGNIDGVYSYSNGAWVSKHSLPPGAVILYRGTEASIETFDGGEAGAITATTGPMWQKVSALDAKFPIGPGTLASGTVIAIGGTGGSEKVELEEENIPLHEIQAYALSDGANLSTVGLIADDDRSATANPNPIDSFGGDEDGDTTPHSNMPPYYGIWFIERTARTHKRI